MTLLLLIPTMAGAAADPVQQQRQWFKQAHQALDDGHMQQFHELRQKLVDYPLAPYLDIWKVWKGMDDGGDQAVAAILQQDGDIPEAYDLHLSWIESLAERGQWPHVAVQLQKLPAAARRMPEIAMLSHWYNGNHDEALKQYSRLWRHGHHFTSRADRMRQAWHVAGHPLPGEAWARIGRLAHRGKWGDIERLARLLPEAQRPIVRQWRRLQHDPAKALRQWQSGRIPEQPARLMLTDALRRLSLDDCAAAWRLLQQVADEFDPEALQALQRHIALRGARRHLPEAAVWLAALPADQQNGETRAWRVRLHLLQHQWVEAQSVIDSMPAKQRDSGRWRYWRARCLAASGRPEQARAIFAELATERGYHSFLAAEYLGLPYQLEDREPEVTRARLDRLAQRPGIRRAHEWWLLNESGKAGREWYAALADATPETWAAAASLARLWGWYDRVIYSAWRAGASDALVFRFPLGFGKAVAQAADESGVHQSLIWSVIRQESAFNMQAVSRSGARGLMQLMPATARSLAGGKADLFDPAENIDLGTRYLARLVDRFDGNEAIAVAAYNAGPSRVSQWLEKTPFIQADIWLEAIPYRETRRYVQQVMAFMIVYDWRQSRQPIGLAARMQSTGREGES